ncbi:hypothetical protein [Paenibacillus sp.]|jgi:Mn-dependent DtxR family transcriptional regulator|uniref:hypothetical protein n=1 Tax=Paenibacillus sp. TaxID=58172 RepID=UPI00281CE4BB|nr:hypothetical protein [Paenibacillus sp.]MDR0268179.1 hypothetical protein [Paenibacillus sp.]
MNELEIRYSTKDIADKLGVEAVTVRKYALALERAGYSIDKIDPTALRERKIAVLLAAQGFSRQFHK